MDGGCFKIDVQVPDLFRVCSRNLLAFHCAKVYVESSLRIDGQVPVQILDAVRQDHAAQLQFQSEEIIECLDDDSTICTPGSRMAKKLTQGKYLMQSTIGASKVREDQLSKRVESSAILTTRTATVSGSAEFEGQLVYMKYSISLVECVDKIGRCSERQRLDHLKEAACGLIRDAKGARIDLSRMKVVGATRALPALALEPKTHWIWLKELDLAAEAEAEEQAEAESASWQQMTAQTQVFKIKGTTHLVLLKLKLKHKAEVDTLVSLNAAETDEARQQQILLSQSDTMKQSKNTDCPALQSGARMMILTALCVCLCAWMSVVCVCVCTSLDRTLTSATALSITFHMPLLFIHSAGAGKGYADQS